MLSIGSGLAGRDPSRRYRGEPPSPARGEGKNRAHDRRFYFILNLL